MLVGLCLAICEFSPRAVRDCANSGNCGHKLAYVVLILLPFAGWKWLGITLELSLLGVVSGIASMACNLLILLMANALAPFMLFATFVYFQIVVATISGAVVFDDWSNMFSWTGIALVLICGGLAISRMSRAKAKAG